MFSSFAKQPSKNVETNVLIKIVVGYRSTVQDHVFEVTSS